MRAALSSEEPVEADLARGKVANLLIGAASVVVVLGCHRALTDPADTGVLSELELPSLLLFIHAGLLTDPTDSFTGVDDTDLVPSDDFFSLIQDGFLIDPTFTTSTALSALTASIVGLAVAPLSLLSLFSGFFHDGFEVDPTVTGESRADDEGSELVVSVDFFFIHGLDARSSLPAD